mgnify:FL=1
MANAVSSFNKQLDQVSTALAVSFLAFKCESCCSLNDGYCKAYFSGITLQAAKKHLSQRMEKLNEKMDEQKEITGAIRLEVWCINMFRITRILDFLFV